MRLEKRNLVLVAGSEHGESDANVSGKDSLDSLKIFLWHNGEYALDSFANDARVGLR